MLPVRSHHTSAKPVSSLNVVSTLSTMRLFEGVDTSVLDEPSIFTVIRFEARQRAFEQGDRADFVYLLLLGRIGLSRVVRSGKEITTSLLSTGHLVGEEALFGPTERTARATALSRVVASIARAEDFVALMHRVPRISLNLARLLHAQREDALSWMEEMAYLKVSERLYAMLVRLASEHGVADGNGIRIELPLTHAYIASLIGSTRESVSAEMGRLLRAGSVRFLGGAYVMPNCTRSELVA